jgi:hypothetical protein
VMRQQWREDPASIDAQGIFESGLEHQERRYSPAGNRTETVLASGLAPMMMQR